MESALLVFAILFLWYTRPKKKINKNPKVSKKKLLKAPKKLSEREEALEKLFQNVDKARESTGAEMIEKDPKRAASILQHWAKQ